MSEGYLEWTKRPEQSQKLVICKEMADHGHFIGVHPDLRPVHFHDRSIFDRHCKRAGTATAIRATVHLIRLRPGICCWTIAGRPALGDLWSPACIAIAQSVLCRFQHWMWVCTQWNPAVRLPFLGWFRCKVGSNETSILARTNLFQIVQPR